MAMESKTVSVIPLNSSDYPTWKIQCQMSLMKDGLWGIVSCTEEAPTGNAERISKYEARRDRALAIIVLSVGAVIAVPDWRA